MSRISISSVLALAAIAFGPRQGNAKPTVDKVFRQGVDKHLEKNLNWNREYRKAFEERNPDSHGSLFAKKWEAVRIAKDKVVLHITLGLRDILEETGEIPSKKVTIEKTIYGTELLHLKDRIEGRPEMRYPIELDKPPTVRLLPE